MSETVDSLKQRLVGAFVILSLAIIFLPMIFDKPHNEGSSILVPVPPKPEFKTIEISKPEQPKFKELEVDEESGKIVKGSNYVAPDAQRRRIVEVERAADASQEVSALENDKESAARSGKGTDAVSSESPAESTKTPKRKVVAVTKETASPQAKVSKPKVSHLPVFKNIWMVQLGTFSNVKNAYRLRDKLRADGFDGHTKEVRLSGKKAIRVFTGPFVKKREAEKIKKKLDQKYKVDSRLIFFDA